MTKPTPKFDAPPVIETVLGVDFDTLPAWDIPHFGLFWHLIRDEYQQCSVVPPLVSRIETFGNEMEVQEGISISDKPEVRCWYYNNAGTWLMQVQKNRFLHNWRKTSEAYPHYEEVKQRFLIAWDYFCQFLSSKDIPKPTIKQCEVSYINHIELDKNWQWSRLSEMFPGWAGLPASEFLSQPEAVVLRTAYRLPDNKGRLRIIAQPGFRHADAKWVMQLELTARIISSSNEDEMSKGFGLGHEWVVNSFADFTSPEMHNIWQRTQ